MKAIYSFLALAFLGISSAFAANPASIPAIPSMAALAALPSGVMAQYSVVQLSDYYSGVSTNGGGIFHWVSPYASSPNGGTIIAPSDHTGTCSYGCMVREYDPRAGVSPRWFGGYGNALLSGAGVANGTTTFTDSSANCTAAYAAGMTYIIINPPDETTDLQVDTTFTCNSATSFNLAAAPSFSGSGVTYTIGHNDLTAFQAAQTAAGLGQFNIDGQYLLDHATTGLGNLDAKVVGIAANGAPARLLIGGLGSYDGVVLTYTNGSAQFQDFEVWCFYSGDDCIGLGDLEGGGVISNIQSFYAAADCWSADGSTGGIQHVTFSGIGAQDCGREVFSVNQTGSAFFNNSTIISPNFRSPSRRQNGGACIVILGSANSSANTVFGAECDASYNSADTYKPYNNPVAFSTGNYRWNFTNLTSESTGGSDVCSAPCSAIGTAYSSSVGTYLAGTFCDTEGASGWADGQPGCVNGFGVVTVGSAAASELVSFVPYSTTFGTLTMTSSSVAGGANSYWAYDYAGNSSSSYSYVAQSGASIVNYGGGYSFTPAAGASSVGGTGSTTLKVTNNGAGYAYIYWTWVGAGVLQWNTQ